MELSRKESNHHHLEIHGLEERKEVEEREFQAKHGDDVLSREEKKPVLFFAYSRLEWMHSDLTSRYSLLVVTGVVRKEETCACMAKVCTGHIITSLLDYSHAENHVGRYAREKKRPYLYVWDRSAEKIL